MTHTEALKRALEALENAKNFWWTGKDEAITALRTALEQSEQDVPAICFGNMEPLAWLESPYGSIRMNTTMRFQFPPQSLKWKIPLYTHPHRREWRGLTDAERAAVQYESFKRGLSPLEFMELHEAALKEKNQ